MKVAIVTDSLSNLPDDIARRYNIFIVRGLIYIDNNRYIETEEITTEQILKILNQKTLKTSVPPPGEYFKVYNQIIDDFDLIISLHSPTKQTAFLKSAKIGSKRIINSHKIIHIECGVATLGLGLVAIASSYLAQKETDINVLREKITKLCQKVEVLGVLDSFDYIKNSGRIKLKVAGTVASLIGVKPVLGMHGSNIFLLDKTRNRQKSIIKLQEQFMKRIDPTVCPKLIGLSHLFDITNAKRIKSTIEAKFPQHEILLTGVDPMTALNTGPGLLLLTYFSKSSL